MKLGEVGMLGDKFQKMFRQRKLAKDSDVSSVIETAFLYPDSPALYGHDRRVSLDQQSDDSAFSDDYESQTSQNDTDTGKQISQSILLLTD